MRSIIFFLLATTSLWCGQRGWNCAEIVEAYYSHSELQRTWAHELIDRVSFKGTEDVLDFGCGDGKITAEISRLIPKGRITGYDISPWMIEFAQTHFPIHDYDNLYFQTTEIQGSYDIICSFCVLHFVSDPVAILNDLKSHLKPEGLFLLTIPGAPDTVMRQAANEMLDRHGIVRPWSLPNYSPESSIRTMKGCEKKLCEAGFEILSLEHPENICFHDSMDEFINWLVGTATANWGIPFSLAQSICSDVAYRMIELDPTLMTEDGRIVDTTDRIHVVARVSLDN